MRNVAESLAGRATYLTLWPMTRREQLGLGREGIWSELIAADDEDWADVVRGQRVQAEDWKALARRVATRRRPWFASNSASCSRTIQARGEALAMVARWVWPSAADEMVAAW